MTGVLVDDRLQIVRQALIAVLVHRKDQGQGVQRRPFEFGMVVHQFRNLERGRNLPRDRRAVDHPVGQCLGHGRNRHTDRCRARQLKKFVDHPTAATDLHALQVGRMNDRLVGVKKAGSVNPGGKDVHSGELCLPHVPFEYLPQCRGSGARVRHHERQFEDLGRGKAPGGVARHCPDDIGDPIDRLVDQFRRRTAKLHLRKPVYLDPPA